MKKFFAALTKSKHKKESTATQNAPAPQRIRHLDKQLIKACQHKDPIKIYSYLTQGANPNVELEVGEGNTLIQLLENRLKLQIWCETPQWKEVIFSCLKLLVEHGANIESTNLLQDTPLAMVIYNKSWVEYLLDKGANPNKPNFRGVTPLMYCNSYRELEILKLCIKHNGKINLVAKDGMTVLYDAVVHAIKDDNYITALFLLKAGANPHCVHRGKSADVSLEEYVYQKVKKRPELLQNPKFIEFQQELQHCMAIYAKRESVAAIRKYARLLHQGHYQRGTDVRPAQASWQHLPKDILCKITIHCAEDKANSLSEREKLQTAMHFFNRPSVTATSQQADHDFVEKICIAKTM